MKAFDPIKPWFISLQETGEFIGIRFGRIAPGQTQPGWIFLPHTDVDGIGGFAKILRDRGVELGRLPQIRHPSAPSRLTVLKMLPKFALPQRKLRWRPFAGPARPGTATEPPSAVAWHAFDEATTRQIRRVCRKACITVNSFLLKHLTKAIRPSLEDESSTVPWMVPVNLRGKINRDTDIENHTSFVSVMVHSYDTVHDVHRSVYEALARGDHWANWYSYDSSRILTGGMRRYLIKIEKCMSQWHVGSFSNLGDWDSERKIARPDCQGTWLFAPPVLRCQQLGAGCVTFQNRLSLMIQAHPEMTVNSSITSGWIQNWIKEIEIDLASVLADPDAIG